MTTRISLKDAQRLGLVATDAADPPRRKPSNGIRATLPTVRKAAKGGRARRDPDAAVTRITFTMDVAPRTKQRARTAMPKREIEGAFLSAKGSFERFRQLLASIRHHSFTPEETKEFEGLVGIYGARAMGIRPPFDCPIVAKVTLCLEGDPGTWPTDVTDPDVDNAVKAVFDGMNGIVYKDDRLVVGKTAWKLCGPKPFVRVSIRALKPRG